MRSLMLAATLAITAGAAGAAQPASSPLTGDYVEARTASVFAGACHYNGELTTAGRQAEMVWHVTSGAWDGTSLVGLNAIASLSSDANLEDGAATRHAVLYIDSHATKPQQAALAAALRARFGKTFGTVDAVKTVVISFRREGESYQVTAPGVTHLAVDAMPNHACCKQPNLVWYKPLATLDNRRVGFTRTSGIEDKTAGELWTKDGQNTAFYGHFSL